MDSSMPLCDYGCGQEATHYSTKVKKHCCVKHPRGCPAYKLVMAERTRKQMDAQSGLTSEQRARGDKERRALRQKNRVAKGKAERPPEGQLCEYGCGQPAQHHLRPLVKDDQGTRFTWKWCCSPHYRQCPKAKEQSWEKQQVTSLERTGYAIHQQSPRFPKVFAATCRARYGVNAPTQSPEIWAKMRATSIKNYGTPWAAQNRTWFDGWVRRRRSFKDYTLPSGRTIRLQGYEPQVVTELLQVVAEEALDFDNIPSFNYIAEDGQQRVYHPDVFIPGINLIIEVKSAWTLMDNYEENRRKQRAVLAAGYQFQFRVWDPRKKSSRIIEDPLPDFPLPE